ncbi:MAG: RNA polymerase sigma factor [Kofleriaceae bacterium]
MAVTAYVDDVLLVDRCISGEAAASRELFRLHRGRVHACLYRVLGANHEVDDLMQEAFLQVFQSLPRWRAEASLATWIDRITVRVAYRHLGQRKRRGPTLTLVPDDAQLATTPLGTNRQHARDGVRRLYQVLDGLSPAARLAFSLHELEGRPMAEVAELIGATVTATKVRVWRARRAIEAAAGADPVLADLLDEHGGAS